MDSLKELNINDLKDSEAMVRAIGSLVNTSTQTAAAFSGLESGDQLPVPYLENLARVPCRYNTRLSGLSFCAQVILFGL